ncbi:DNA gyrase inhibitor YacG [Legionella hackeliae]|nr:DNA gyrase inhibitor YacG [Legionella hackeliae]
MMNQQKISCPTCGKRNTWQLKNTFKPFCSDRCKLIDLGEWANESRVIPGNTIDPDLTVQISNDLDEV